jgi:alanine dehydrogenase
MKLGVIREGKNPPDKRVPLTPAQCVEVEKLFPHVEVVVQSSNVRKITDKEYTCAGAKVVDDVSDCDILIGVKEVNKPDLIPNKKYLFFSHTYKKQPYNRDLLNEILDKKIQLIDYEVLKDKNNQRLIGFGKYAGIVGCYNGFLTFGKKHNLYHLKPANQCEDRVEFNEELKNVKLPNDFKVVLTGFGRVGHGAREVIQSLGLKEVSANDFLTQTFNEPVFTQLKVQDYFERADGAKFDKSAFYKSGAGHISVFNKYMTQANMYIACHYWNSSSPFIFTREDLKSDNIKTSVVADISCDIDGPVASTIRPSAIADPIYGYNPATEKEADFMQDGIIAVMAVDNLPCELPKDASKDFGDDLIDKIFPSLFGEDTDGIIERASQTNLDGGLTKHFSYLEKYIAGEE